MILPVAAIIAGFIIGLQLKAPIPPEYVAYLGLAVMGGIDTVLGGYRSSLEGKFNGSIFLTGFLGNILMGSALAWLGEQMGINLFLVVAFVYGGRIFNNLSIIRRILLTRWSDWREQTRLEAERAKQAAAAPASKEGQS